MHSEAANLVTLQPLEQLETLGAQRRGQVARFRRLATRLMVWKRVYLASFIGYVVFDPTVAAVLFPVAISLVPLVIWQHQLVLRWNRYWRSMVFYERAVSRIQGRWIGVGDAGLRYLAADHPYSGDLDVFGRGSLFELYGTPPTASGRDTVAHWLLGPADPATIRARQGAVRELRDDLELRELLGVTVPIVPMRVVRAAAAAETVFARRWLRWGVAAAAWSGVAAVLIAYDVGGPWCPLLVAILSTQAILYLVLRRRVLVLGSRGHQIGLGMVARGSYRRALAKFGWSDPQRLHPELNRLASKICGPTRPLPGLLASMVGLVVQLPVVYFLVLQLLPIVETRLIRCLARMPDWWEAVGELEALCAFAAQAFEHPADTFPEIVEAAGPCFDARQIGHPLIHETKSRWNDVRLDSQLQLLMVSGSNMSGKSTLLRTVGVNAVLALAGAPVRAQALRISPLVIGTAMRFQDSLEQSTSYFYSVLRRLCSVLDLLGGPVPLLFLLDEILQGTNSHDRLAGAEAVIRKLLAQSAIGLVTTHDLELTRVADHLAPHAANVHFIDSFVNEQMTFDYRMRPGVVKSSNALALMRSMGLDV